MAEKNDKNEQKAVDESKNNCYAHKNIIKNKGGSRMKRKWKRLAVAASVLMAFTLAMPASAATPTVGYYNGHKYTVTASKNGAVACGTVDYEADSYLAGVAIWGTMIGKGGSRENYGRHWGLSGIYYTNPYGSNILSVNTEGFIDGVSVGYASVG